MQIFSNVKCSREAFSFSVTVKVHKVITDCYQTTRQSVCCHLCTTLHHITANRRKWSKNIGLLWFGRFLQRGIHQKLWCFFFPHMKALSRVVVFGSGWRDKNLGLHAWQCADVVPQEGSTHTIFECFSLRTFFLDFKIFVKYRLGEESWVILVISVFYAELLISVKWTALRLFKQFVITWNDGNVNVKSHYAWQVWFQVQKLLHVCNMWECLEALNREQRAPLLGFFGRWWVHGLWVLIGHPCM